MYRSLIRAGITVFVLGLLVSTGARPAEAAAGPSPLGVYHGFFQSSATPGRWGLVEFAISQTRNRRFFGMVTMIIPDGASEIRLPFAVDGTLAADDRVVDEAGTLEHELGHNLGLGHGAMIFTGVGRSAAGMVQFHGRLLFFDGGAALADSTYVFYPPDPGLPGEPPPDPDRGTSTILRSFEPNTPAPNVSGMWDGRYSSDTNGGQGSLHLDITQACDAGPNPTADVAPVLSNSFMGQEVVDKGTDHELTLYFGGSIGSSDPPDPDRSPFIVIGWDLAGDRFVVAGGMTPPDGTTPASGKATYELLFANGTIDRGSFDIMQQFVPPDPCRIIGDVTGQ